MNTSRFLLLLGEDHVQSRQAEGHVCPECQCQPVLTWAVIPDMPVCQCRGQLLPGSPAPAAFQELHLLRPIRVTSQNSNLPAACHFKIGSVEGIAECFSILGCLTQLLLQKPYDIVSVTYICWHGKKVKQNFRITLYVIHTHSYSFAY